MKISAIQPISNAVCLGYPFIEAILSALPIVDEFLINDGGSKDKTPYYLKKLKKTFPDKIKLFNKPFYPSNHWETIDECIEFLINKARGDWIFEVQGDELWHEKDIFKLKQVIKKASKQGYNSIRGICHWFTFESIDSYKYRNVRIIRKIKNLKSYSGGDDFQMGSRRLPPENFTSSNVPPELITDIVYFDLKDFTFHGNAIQRVKTVATFFAKKQTDRKQRWKHFETILPREPRLSLEDIKQLPALIQGLAGLYKYKMREELFDKKFLRKLTGLQY